jgi:hypothetical protein
LEISEDRKSIVYPVTGEKLELSEEKNYVFEISD